MSFTIITTLIEGDIMPSNDEREMKTVGQNLQTEDGNDSPFHGTDASQLSIRGFSPPSTDVLKSSEEDEDELSCETKAIETRASKKRNKKHLQPQSSTETGQKKAMPLHPLPAGHPALPNP